MQAGSIRLYESDFAMQDDKHVCCLCRLFPYAYSVTLCKTAPIKNRQIAGSVWRVLLQVHCLVHLFSVCRELIVDVIPCYSILRALHGAGHNSGPGDCQQVFLGRVC